MRPLIVAIHIPKTGGVSFQRTLETHFGAAYRRDDADRPLHVGRATRRLRALRRSLFAAPRQWDEIDCVHGHFLAAGWRGLSKRRDLRFVTWLRDPVERLASHYRYWQRSYDRRESLPLQRRVVEEEWSFERFALGPEMRNVAAEFLWRLPRRHLAFVGLTERYEADHARFCREFLSVELSSVAENVNPKVDRERHAQVVYVSNQGLRARIAAHHERDMELYEWASRHSAGSAQPMA